MCLSSKDAGRNAPVRSGDYLILQQYGGFSAAVLWTDILAVSVWFENETACGAVVSLPHRDYFTHANPSQILSALQLAKGGAA